MTRLPGITGVLIFLCAAGLAGPNAPRAGDHDRTEPRFDGLGTYARAVTTTSREAQDYFNQGLNFLFAFNHDEAGRSFRQAAEIDPQCAMAWWGVAIAQGPHINRPVVEADAARTAWEAIGKARSASSRASQSERALIAALAERCVASPPEDRTPLDRAYADAMSALRARYPGDANIGALAAEARMNLRPWDLHDEAGRPRTGTEAIITTLEDVLRLEPGHPFANHLYIHAVEGSSRPGRAEAAADRLRDLQPGLSHNLHMPSHIDVRLGHWKKAEEANRNAIAADRRFLSVRHDPGFYGLYIAHNYHMLAFAAMMRGVSRTAVEAIDEMTNRIPPDWAKGHAAIADGYLAMPLEVRMRFGRWDEILAAPEPDAAFPLARALRHYARAVALAALGRVAEARAEQQRFRDARARVPEDRRFGNNAAADLLDIAGHVVEGEILYREGREDQAFAALREAARREDALRYSEPPDWILPARHALGAALSRSGRLTEAERVYRDDLQRLPDNGWSLFGLSRSLERQGRDAEARRLRDRWEEIWRDADFELTSSCLCLPGT